MKNTKDITKMTCRAVPSNIECAARFVKTLPKAKDGANALPISDFMMVAHLVLTNYASFTVSDFLTLAKAKDLPADATTALFKKWSEKMVAYGRIKRVQGAYDEDVFSVI